MENLQQARYHAWFHHKNADGWITVAKKDNGHFKQYHYNPDELADKLGEWIGEDVYFSQNTFFKPFRAIETVRQLRSLYVDVDFYLFNFEPSWVLAKLEHEFFGQAIPNPNVIIFSGQGIVLIWLLDPVPYKALPLWQSVQNYLLGQLKELGGDPKASDAARVFRIAGSTNSKNGTEVYAEYRHDYRYELRQLQQDYLPELNDEIKQKKKPGRKKKAAQLFNTHRLHYARLRDIVKLVELRNYQVTGHRELICFLYRYWLCCYSSDPTESLNQTISFNLQFSNPLPTNEVEKATRSAEKAWEAKNNAEANRLAKQKGYPGAGYNLKNSTIIEWLDISSEEMKHLSTIIDGPEKRRRKRDRDRLRITEKRREQGVQKREDYIKQQHDITDDKLFKLQELLKKGLKRKEIIEVMQISLPYYKKLKRML